MKLMSGNPNQMLEAASEAYSMGKAAAGQVKENAVLLAHGVANPGDVLDAMAQIGIEKSGEAIGGATFETALLVAPAAKGAPVAAVAQEGRRAAVAAAIEESSAARAASRVGEYANNPAVQAAERGAAQRAAVQAAVRESQAVRAAAQKAGGFGRYVAAEKQALAPSSAASEAKIGKFLEGGDVAEIRANAARAAGEGCCVTGVVDRSGAATRRGGRMKGVARRSGYDRDEFPPAAIRPDNPSNFRVDYTNPSQNRRSGVRLKQEIRTLPDGTRVRIEIPDE